MSEQPGDHAQQHARSSAELLAAIGEPVSVFYEPRNGSEHAWTVGLQRVPMIHEHFPSFRSGLRWLAEHKDHFPDWEQQIARAGTRPPFAVFGDAVDAAQGFSACWTNDGSFEDVLEWATQLRVALDEAFARVHEQR